MTTKSSKYQKKLQEIAERSGIDFTRYRDPVLVDKIGKMLTIQLYAFKAIAVPVMSLMLIFAAIGVYAFISAKVMAGIIIMVIGIIPALLLGVLTGLIILMTTVKNDVNSIINLSIDTVKIILMDSNTALQTKIQNISEPHINLPKISDVLQGVVLGIVLPSIQQIIVTKFSLLKVPLAYVFDKMILTVVNSMFEFIDVKANKEMSKYTDKAGAVLDVTNKIV
jgi:hypothetical protein